MSLKPFPYVSSQTNEITLVSNTRRHVDPISGATQTEGRAGSRYRIQCRWRDIHSDDAARLRALASTLDGQTHRVYVPDFGYKARGGLQSTNLANALEAANFTTGSVPVTFSDGADGVHCRADQAGSVGEAFLQQANLSGFLDNRPYAFVTQYAPLSVMDEAPLQGTLNPRYRQRVDVGGLINGVDDVSMLSANRLETTFFTFQNDGDIDLTNSFLNHQEFDRFVLTDYSVARCLLVDNGVNDMGYNREFENWTEVRSDIQANQTIAPDGTVSGYTLADTTDNDTHYIVRGFTRSSSERFVTIGLYAKSNSLRDIEIRVQESGAGANYASAAFDLDSGTVISSGSGGNYFKDAATITSIGGGGGGWYFCRLTTYANTNLNHEAVIYTHNGTSNSYVGDGSSVRLWRFSVRPGMEPGREIFHPTNTPVGNDTAQTGSSLFVSGFEPSQASQLKLGDLVSIQGQLLRLTQDVDSDERQAGKLHFEPQLRQSPPDGTPVILHRPTALCMLDGNEAAYNQSPYPDGSSLVDESLSFVEDIAV